jgi:rhodanese-related sulfurtransferase
MSSLSQLHAQAVQRSIEQHLPYAGAVTPTEAFAWLQSDPQARLVDVRTRAELDWVGRPLVDKQQYAHLEWSYYPEGASNLRFIEQLQQIASPDTPILLLCRSAGRSKLAAAAASRAGFKQAFDILEGFEGDKDREGHRKTINGWCVQGLPWVGA